MFGFYKGEPSSYVIRYSGGKAKQHGEGLTFWYMPYNTTIATIPVVSQDARFIFTESTLNYQEISIQGQLSFRLSDPVTLASVLDFSIDPADGTYKSEDPDKLPQRIINAVQSNIRNGINLMSLEEALVKVKELERDVLQAIQQAPDLTAMGVIVESLHITTVKATPEMKKALEADYRESLQQRADQAIYSRRNAAVEEESKIKHRELNTEVELEERRRDLVETQAENNLTLAEAEAKADELKLSPYGALPPQALIGLALKEWAANAGNIGQLNLSPDMLSQLVGWVGSQSSPTMKSSADKSNG